MSRKLRTNRPALALVLIACVVLSAMTAASPAGAQDDRSARSRLGLVQTGPGRFSIDVQGADIHTVLRAIAEFSGKNIVAGSAVKGQISVALHDMPWRDALTTITRANGLDFTEEAGAIRVDTAEKLQAELLARETNEARRLEVQPLQTRIVHLNYGAARELQPVLQSTLSKRGTIQVDERTNSVVVTDVADNVESVEKMALTLDSETPQIEITSKLVDVDVSALRDIGVEWSVQSDLGQTGATTQDFQIKTPAANPAGT